MVCSIPDPPETIEQLESIMEVIEFLLCLLDAFR